MHEYINKIEMATLSDRELDLKERRLNLEEKIVTTQLQRGYDLQYLKLVVIMVLLIVIVFYITCKLNTPVSEHVSEPQVGLLTNEVYRSDPAFDWFKF